MTPGTRWPAALLLVAALVGCGKSGGATATQPSRSNTSPTVTVQVSPGSGAVMAATTLTFIATANDPDGDPLSFSWQFGDGSSGSGQAVTHLFQAAGTFSVGVTVTDNRGGSGSASALVVVSDLSSGWKSLARDWNISLVQRGLVLTGRLEGYKNQSYGPGTPGVAITGVITPPNGVRFGAEAFSLNFTGTVTSPEIMEGTLFDCVATCRNYGERLQRMH